MTLGNLVKWRDWWYYPTMNELSVFDAATGQRVSMWYVWSPHNVEYKQWHFCCNVNTLPENVQFAFATEVVAIWRKHVDEKLTVAFCGGDY